ncbi:MAG: 6-carboxytetrahydropterin synthase [Fimbriimonadales bacterium]|nr:6-carboxytetrahydropterin synthase [Fimbriimonadales bacterium]
MSNRVCMWRRVAFSSGHRYWVEGLSAEENQRVFGKWASPFNHGHNYVLWVGVSGVPDAAQGMLVNIKEIDNLLKRRIVSLVDGRSLNDEVPELTGVPTTLENLAAWIGGAVRNELQPGLHLEGVRLYEKEDLWVELTPDSEAKMADRVVVCRQYEFAAAHRLHCAELGTEENLKLYGKCNHPAGHGHNYVLEIGVEGTPDPVTGMSVDLEELDRVVTERVLERYDHRNLDVDVPELQGRVTTSENVAIAIWRQLEGRVPGRLRRVRLFETARNAFEVEDWS